MNSVTINYLSYQYIR